METVIGFIFLGSKITADDNCSHETERHLLLGRKAMTNLDSILKSRDITLPTKLRLIKAMIFSLVMYGCESWTIKEGWVPKNCSFQTVVLEKTLESPLDYKEIKPVNSKETQCWIFIGRTDAEALILWPPDAKIWLTGKDPDAGKDWGQKEKVATEDEMVGLHHYSMDRRLSKPWEIVKDREAWHAAVYGLQRVGHNWALNKKMLSFQIRLRMPRRQALFCSSLSKLPPLCLASRSLHLADL